MICLLLTPFARPLSMKRSGQMLQCCRDGSLRAVPEGYQHLNAPSIKSVPAKKQN